MGGNFWSRNIEPQVFIRLLNILELKFDFLEDNGTCIPN
jgi:hypothetical protein